MQISPARWKVSAGTDPGCDDRESESQSGSSNRTRDKTRSTHAGQRIVVGEKINHAAHVVLWFACLKIQVRQIPLSTP